MTYEKPVAEITNFEVEAIMNGTDVGGGVGPSNESGTGSSPFG